MDASAKKKIALELERLHKKHGALDPSAVVNWAQTHPTSALHGRFQWNNSKAAHEYRLWQARELITEVTVIYPDGKTRQVYVSPVESRGNGGYASLVEVLSDAERRAAFLAQALAEYERVGEKYQDLRELAGVRSAVRKVHVRVARPKSTARINVRTARVKTKNARRG